MAVCSASALDQRSNNFSLFGLIEQLQVVQFPAALPLEVHVYYEFDETELGQPHEVRIELFDEQAARVWHSPWITMTSPSRRHRMVLSGIQFPSPALFHVHAVHRIVGAAVDDSIRSSGWPIEVGQASLEAPPTA
jgi:hypothetical protein